MKTLNITALSAVSGLYPFKKSGLYPVKIETNGNIKTTTINVVTYSNQTIAIENGTLDGNTSLALTNNTNYEIDVVIDSNSDYCLIHFDENILIRFNDGNNLSEDGRARVAYDEGSWSILSNLNSMFLGRSNFNQDISNWDTSNVTDMTNLAGGCLNFTRNISNWDFSKVVNFQGMFANSPAPLHNDFSLWNISTNLNNIRYMMMAMVDSDFSSWAGKFNINVMLDGWFLDNGGMTTLNYDKFLNALWLDYNTTRASQWATRTNPKNLGVGVSKYSSAGASARTNLVNAGWNISDAGII